MLAMVIGLLVSTLSFADEQTYGDIDCSIETRQFLIQTVTRCASWVDQSGASSKGNLYGKFRAYVTSDCSILTYGSSLQLFEFQKCLDAIAASKGYRIK